MSVEALLYDYRRDGSVAEGEALLRLEDGRWSGQVLFTGGFAWGVAPDLSTVSLGSDGEVVGYLKGGALPHNISQVAIAVLEKIQAGKEKERFEDGKAGANFKPTSQYRAGKVRMQRVKPAGNVKYGLRNFRKTPAKA